MSDLTAEDTGEDDDRVDYPDPEEVDVDPTPEDEGDDTVHGGAR